MYFTVLFTTGDADGYSRVKSRNTDPHEFRLSGSVRVLYDLCTFTTLPSRCSSINTQDSFKRVKTQEREQDSSLALPSLYSRSLD
jgi:hypothetical protein